MGVSDGTGQFCFAARRQHRERHRARGTTALDMTRRSGHGLPCPYDLRRQEQGDGNKKRALTERPSELNHFDDTLAGSEPPAPANHHEEERPK